MTKGIIIRLTVLILLLLTTPLPALTDLDEPQGILVESMTGEIGQLATETDVTIVSTGDESLTSGLIDLVDYIPHPRIIVSEVFFDGSDERFELANIGSGHFTGTLVIKGVKSIDLYLTGLSLSSGAVYVRGDTMSQISDRSIIQNSSLGLSISDSNSLQVEVYFSGQLLDTLSVSSSLISSTPNNHGFEKLLSGSDLHVLQTDTQRVYNISGTHIANPGIIYTYVMPTVPTESPPSTTTGVISTGDTTLSTNNQSILRITEIHPGNDILPEYIELLFLGIYNGTLRIEGAGNGATTKSILINAYTGQYIIVADSLSGFVDTYPVRLIDNLSLTDAGEHIAILSSSGDIYSYALYTGYLTNFSRYPDTTSGYSISLFPTPGFSESALRYLPQTITSDTSVVETSEAKDSYYQSLYKKRKDRYYDLKTQIGYFGVGINKAGMVYKKEGSSQVELINGSEDFTTTATLDTHSVLKIISILPDAEGKDEGNEEITIALISGGSINLADVIVRSNTKKTPLLGVLQHTGEHHMLKGNFSFPNKPTCITLEQDTTILDTFCYGQPKAGITMTLSGDVSDDLVLSGIHDFSWMKQLRFELSTGQACALFGETPFDCVSIKPMMDEKIKVKYDTKIASLQGKYDNKQRQYTGLQERYKSMKNSLDTKRRKYYQQVKSVRKSYQEKLTDAKLEVKVWKNYGQLLQADLKDHRYIVRQNSSIIAINSLLEANISALTQADDQTTLTLDGQTFTIGNLRQQYAFISDPAAILDGRVGEGLSFFSPEAAALRANRLDIWYADTQ